MFYDRKIRYLDYCENGERIRGGGFARTEIKDTEFRMEITVKCPQLRGGLVGTVILIGQAGEWPVGQIEIQNGLGQFQHICCLEGKNDGLSMKYEELTGIRIAIADDREIRCTWVETQLNQVVKRPEVKVPMESFVAEKKLPKETENEIGKEETGKKIAVREVGAGEKKTNTFVAERKAVQQMQGEPEKEVKTAEMPETEEPVNKVTAPEKSEEPRMPLLEDKWLQLCAIYPRVKPFRDEREYLSVSPADFVLLSAESYRIANNSFLLHGFYNYRHLILTRIEKRGEILYYIGVPGNYFDREKQVAVMFGFESFECAEEPAQSGDFGYYMMRVQI